MLPKFTDTEWPMECLVQLIVNEVQRWENFEAVKQVVVAKDNSIVSGTVSSS
jgi:hypothetical protein